MLPKRLAPLVQPTRCFAFQVVAELLEVQEFSVALLLLKETAALQSLKVTYPIRYKRLDQLANSGRYVTKRKNNKDQFVDEMSIKTFIWQRILVTAVANSLHTCVV